MWEPNRVFCGFRAIGFCDIFVSQKTKKNIEQAFADIYNEKFDTS
jgi:hypothetical protein